MTKKLVQNEDVKHLGIGIDTARYGHCAAFLRDDKNPVANLLEFRESGDGYRKLRRKIEQLHLRYPEVQIHVRIDAAGQYAANLEHFVRSIQQPQLSVSLGEPKRGKKREREKGTQLFLKVGQLKRAASPFRPRPLFFPKTKRPCDWALLHLSYCGGTRPL